MIDKLQGWYAWPFFSVLPRVHKGLATAWWALIVVRGALPAVLTVAVAALLSAVQRQDSLVPPLAAVSVVFLLMQLLAPVHAQTGASLGDWLSSWLHDKLAEATTKPSGLAHLESRELTDRLTMARDFDLGISGPPMSISIGLISGGLVEAMTGLSQASVLFAFAWWAPPLVAGAWLATHWLLRESGGWDRGAQEVLDAQRRAEYTYRLAVDAPAAKELRIFGLGRWTVGRFAAERRRMIELRWQATRLRQRPLLRVVLVVVTANAVVFWAIAREAASGALDIGQVAMFALAAVGASGIAFGGINWALPPTAESVTAVLGLSEAMEETGRLVSGNRSAEGGPAAYVRLKELGFSYPGSTKPVFDGLDVTIEAGTSLAVVGVNGAGKTTLAKLLCRLYDPTSGAIEVDGVDLRDLDLESWRSRVTAVFQDFVRYQLPLRDNVSLHDTSDDVIRAALADAGAKDLAELDTVLSRGYDDGTDLSGGQWQRVAVARALCAVRLGAGLVILDEPTAQLDVRGEAEIFERILEATRGVTTVLISHRFSTVRHADRICVLEEGRVVELGTHAELMAARGRYRHLYDLQASRFAESPVSGDDCTDLEVVE
ncbi:ABC transporter ATP-binding protein [Streptomyces hainanensis]|uniref:ABC transporter ATP-binding protein n=1 Tax=Streptomyces hainanensis TaxID=402648 RepID=A0A4R4TUI2_9ACTN|nr:ABC transporter ATP-binding protein [Streptomyces hainanensis]TDC79222.1 ABC transporter ATP-binding protein [Streptomyces hainanensis]